MLFTHKNFLALVLLAVLCVGFSPLANPLDLSPSSDLFQWDSIVSRAHESVLGIQQGFLNLLGRFSRPTEACFSTDIIQMKARQVDPVHSAGTCAFHVLHNGTLLFCSFEKDAPFFQPHADGNQCSVILSTLTPPVWKEISLTSFVDSLNSKTLFGSFGNAGDLPFRLDTKRKTLGSLLIVARCNGQRDVYQGSSELIRSECY